MAFLRIIKFLLNDFDDNITYYVKKITLMTMVHSKTTYHYYHQYFNCVYIYLHLCSMQIDINNNIKNDFLITNYFKQ